MRPQLDEDELGGSDFARHSTSTLHEASEHPIPPSPGKDTRRSTRKGSTISRPTASSDAEKGIEDLKGPGHDLNDPEKPIIVDWKGADDPNWPLNWSYSRRMLTTIT